MKFVHKIPCGFLRRPVHGDAVPYLILNNEHTQLFKLLPNCMDCLELLSQLPDNCISLILTDPPYDSTVARRLIEHEDKIAVLKDIFHFPACQKVFHVLPDKRVY